MKKIFKISYVYKRLTNTHKSAKMNPHKNNLQYIQRLVLLFFLAQMISACTTTSKYRQMQFDDNFEDIKVYSFFDQEFSSQYFGSLRFVFENKIDQWQKIDNIRLSFVDDSAKKYISVLDRNEIEEWGQAVRMQSMMNVSTLKELQSAIISAGSSITPMVGDVSKTVGLSDDQSNKEYPKNHLYAADFVLPPGFSMEKWILLNSSNHQAMPYLTDLNLTLAIENKSHIGRVKFRDNPNKYNNFLWYDSSRDVDLNFYLGLSIGMALPMGDFKDVVNKSDNLINSFGINGYLSFNKLFGINFSADYESFPSRGNLPVPFDSLNAFGIIFEFSDWEIYSFLISPRFTYPLSQEAELFAEISIGAALTNSSQIVLKRAGVEAGKVDPASAFSLMAGFGAGSRFYLSDKMNLDIKLAYFPLPNASLKSNILDLFDVDISQKLNQLRLKVTANWDI